MFTSHRNSGSLNGFATRNRITSSYGRRNITHKTSTLWTNLPTALKDYSSINKFSKKFKSLSAVRNHLLNYDKPILIYYCCRIAIGYCKSVTANVFVWCIIILFGSSTCLYCWFTVCLCECGYKCLNISNACKCNNGRPAWWALAFLAAHHLYNSICWLHFTYCLLFEMEVGLKYDDKLLQYQSAHRSVHTHTSLGARSFSVTSHKL